MFLGFSVDLVNKGLLIENVEDAHLGIVEY